MSLIKANLYPAYIGNEDGREESKYSIDRLDFF